MSQDEIDFDMEQISAQETEKGNFGHGILLYGSNDPEVLVEQCAENLQNLLWKARVFLENFKIPFSDYCSTSSFHCQKVVNQMCWFDYLILYLR
ncbi:hypothetical protein N8988_03685 [Opitutales bacterium]|nr:hypothetical protein [Opitutales bacterium]